MKKIILTVLSLMLVIQAISCIIYLALHTPIFIMSTAGIWIESAIAFIVMLLFAWWLLDYITDVWRNEKQTDSKDTNEETIDISIKKYKPSPNLWLLRVGNIECFIAREALLDYEFFGETAIALYNRGIELDTVNFNELLSVHADILGVKSYRNGVCVSTNIYVESGNYVTVDIEQKVDGVSSGGSFFRGSPEMLIYLSQKIKEYHTELQTYE